MKGVSMAKQEKRKKKKKSDDPRASRFPWIVHADRRLDNAPISFVQSYSLFFLFSFLLLFFSLSLSPPFYLEDPTKVAPLNGPRHIASAVSRVDGECFEWVLKHEASACHRPRTTRILADGEKTRVKRRERVRQWGITRWITSASYTLYPLAICNLDFIIGR